MALKRAEDQLALQQRQRDLAAAKDRGLLQSGQITEVESMRRNNARVQEAIADNRSQQAVEERPESGTGTSA